MLLGVVSDTHGNLKGIQELCRQLRQAGVTLVFHLGDDYRDTDWLAAEGFQVIAVPGLYCPEYHQPQIPRVRLEEVGGVRFLLAHSPEHTDLGATNPKPQVILSGHTHIPSLKRQEGVVWLNPGHLKEQDKKGYPPTYALLRLEPPRLQVEIIQLNDGKVLLADTFTLPPGS